MKGALVEVELAMTLLRAQDLPLQRPVRLVIINDEETGSVDGQRIVAAHAQNAHASINLLLQRAALLATYLKYL